MVPEPNTGCWLWTGGTNEGGYGIFNMNLKTVRAHRASYEFHFGRFEKKLCVLHKCDTPACINPNHLFLGTHSDNARDMVTKKRHHYQNITHCKNGHEYTQENIVFLKNPKRRECRICKNRGNAEYKKRLKEKTVYG